MLTVRLLWTWDVLSTQGAAGWLTGRCETALIVRQPRNWGHKTDKEKKFALLHTLSWPEYPTYTGGLFSRKQSERNKKLTYHLYVLHPRTPPFHNGQFSCTRWFKYDQDKLWLVYTQTVPVIFELPCIRNKFQSYQRRREYFAITTACPDDYLIPRWQERHFVAQVYTNGVRPHTVLHFHKR